MVVPPERFTIPTITDPNEALLRNLSQPEVLDLPLGFRFEAPLAGPPEQPDFRRTTRTGLSNYVVHSQRKDGLPLSSQMSPRSFPRSSSHSSDSRFVVFAQFTPPSLAASP